MDSLTQLMLGAAIGQIVLGKKNNMKGALLGGIAATLPDLDVVPMIKASVITQLTNHRGLSHSLIFCLTSPFLFTWLSRKYSSLKASYKRWWLFWFLVFTTHIQFDLMTTWGTQILWPINWRPSLDSWFIIDPLVTIPLIIGCIFTKLTKRLRAVKIGITFCSIYMIFSISAHFWMLNQFKTALFMKNISIEKLIVRPTPFNTIFWSTTAKTTNDTLVMGHGKLWGPISSFKFDPPIKQNSVNLNPFKENREVQKLVQITKGYYVIKPSTTSLIVQDARYGTMGGWMESNNNFLFNYEYNLSSKKWTQSRPETPNLTLIIKSLFKQITQ